MLDGGKALRKGVADVFGKSAIIQRCKCTRTERALVPSRIGAGNVSIAMTMHTGNSTTIKRKQAYGYRCKPANRYPPPQRACWKGLKKPDRAPLKVPGLLRETLCSTNPMESANSTCRARYARIQFRTGEMALRHAAAGFMRLSEGSGESRDTANSHPNGCPVNPRRRHCRYFYIENRVNRSFQKIFGAILRTANSTELGTRSGAITNMIICIGIRMSIANVKN